MVKPTNHEMIANEKIVTHSSQQKGASHTPVVEGHKGLYQSWSEVMGTWGKRGYLENLLFCEKKYRRQGKQADD